MIRNFPNLSVGHLCELSTGAEGRGGQGTAANRLAEVPCPFKRSCDWAESTLRKNRKIKIPNKTVHERRNWEWGQAVSFLGIYVLKFQYSVRAWKLQRMRFNNGVGGEGWWFIHCKRKEGGGIEFSGCLQCRGTPRGSPGFVINQTRNRANFSPSKHGGAKPGELKTGRGGGGGVKCLWQQGELKTGEGRMQGSSQKREGTRG